MPITIASETRIDIARVPAQVFEFVALRWFDNLRRWRPELIEVTPLGDGVIRVGTRGVELRRMRRGKRRNASEGRTFEVTEMISPGVAALSARPGPAVFALAGIEDRPGAEVYTSRFVFEELGARTRLRWRFAREYENPLFVLPSPFIRLRIRLDMNRSLRLLREVLER